MSYNPAPLSQNPMPIIDPSLNDALLLMQKKINLELTCHHLGTIQSFDTTTQTAVVSINYTKTYFTYNPATNTNDPTSINYPLLTQVPVVFLGGGTTSLTFPVTAGDQCILLFNDRDIGNWFKGNPPMPLGSSRLHSFADAIAIVGIRPVTASLTGFSTTDAVLQNGLTKVSVGPSLITIANAVTTLNTLLQDLLTAIEGLTTINCVPGDPVTLSPATIAAIQAIGVQIGELLA